jgi:hypothetical protein
MFVWYKVTVVPMRCLCRKPRYRNQKKQYKGHLQRIENKRVRPMAG